MKADIQSLMDLCRANEEAEEFDLTKWISEPIGFEEREKTISSMLCYGDIDEPPCGTYGCLVGNHLLKTREWEKLDEIDRGTFSTAAHYYGLTSGEAEFLFSSLNHEVGPNGLIPDGWGGYRLNVGSHRRHRDKDAAIRRVRKLIYYKLRKQELCYEEDGRVKESARRAEGDHRIDRKVLAAC